MQPPVVARLVPPRAALGVAARLCAWPLVYAGAYAIAPGDPRFVAAALALASLMASTVASSQSTGVSRAGLGTAAAAVAIPSYALARALGWASPLVVLVGAFAAVAFGAALSATRTREDAPLDADARAIAPVAAWIAIAAAVTRFGAEAVHLHRVLPAGATVVSALATLLAIAGIAIFVRQRAWTGRVYAGDARPLRVAALPEAAAAVRPLSAVAAACDAAIVAAPDELGPYRAPGDRAIVARVPSSAGPLLASQTRALRTAGAAAAIGASALFVAGGPLPARTHADEPRIGLRPLPAACATDRPMLRFVALEPLRAVSIDAIADHYRRAGIADVAEPRALVLEDRFVDPARDQIVAEDVADAARAAFAPREHELVIVVTDHDMYLRTMTWRWAFAYRRDGVSVVSVARMDPSFPWLGASTYRPERPECGVNLHARAHKMITRQVLFAACKAPEIDDPRSARRPSVLSLEDLDAVDERVY